MSLEQLKQQLASQVKVVEGYRLAKLNAVDGIEFGKRYENVSGDAPFEQVAEGYVFLLSKSIVTEDGRKELDSDEGRELLKQLERVVFCRLGEAAIEWNFDDSKKN